MHGDQGRDAIAGEDWGREVKLVDAVNESVQRVEQARAKVDRKRVGNLVDTHAKLNAAAFARRSVACPSRGQIHPAAWVLNMAYSTVCQMMEAGLFIYNPKGGSK